MDRTLAGLGSRIPARSGDLSTSGPFVHIDAMQQQTVAAVVDEYGIDIIYHLAAILSAAGEEKPQLAWRN